MTFVRPLARIILAAACALLASCIDSREEIWINEDGSGRAELSYCVPVSVARMHGGGNGIHSLITDLSKRSPQITLTNVSVETNGKFTNINVNAAFESVAELMELRSGETSESIPSVANHLLGEAKAVQHGRTINYSRTIDLSGALPGAAFLPATRFDGHHMLYIIHLPAAAVSSNATRAKDGQRTLVWDIPLRDAIRKPITTRFTIQMPIPWKNVSAVAIPLLLICGFVFSRIRRSRAAA